jgi:serine phosphatase RsbU (regulator of sigma subunit)
VQKQPPRDAERPAADTERAAPQAGIERQAERVVIDMTGAIEEALKKYEGGGRNGQPTPAWVAPLVRGVAQGLQAGAAVTAQGLRLGALEIARKAQQEALANAQMTLGGEWGIPVRHEGRVVGTLNAKLNVERVLGTVFGLARVDQGELPFAVDESGKLFTPVKDKKSTLENLGVGQVRGEPGTTRVDSRDDWLVVSRRDPSGMTFGIARPLGESLKTLRRTTMQNLMLGLAVVGIALIGMVPLSHGMTRKLGVLVEGAQAVAKGDYGHKVPVQSNDEIGRLAGAFNDMAESIQKHQKATLEQERLKQELDLCRRIQAEMLPHGPMNLGFGEVKGVSIPAREVGGDFFNYFALDDGKVALLVGDVSGKGVGAALLMANVQATLRARLPLEQDLAQLVDAVDRDVDDRTPGGVYVTLFIGILDPRTRRLRYVNAGHHPQFVLRRNGALERMPSAGLPVGLFAGHGYREQEMTLEGGDLLFFYTDGTIETENEREEMFGIERLEALLASQHEYDTVLERVESALRDFRGKAELFDDATMMALRVDVADAPVATTGARQEALAPAG